MRDILKYFLVTAIVGLLAVGLYPITEKPKAQDYSDPQIPVGKYDELASVDIARSGDDIWVVDHRLGHLIFELSGKKKADVTSAKVYRELLKEASSNEVNRSPSNSYLSK